MSKLFQTGCFYKSFWTYLMVYPAKEKRYQPLAATTIVSEEAIYWAKKLSEEFGYEVDILKPNEPFLVLESVCDSSHVKILRTSNGRVGWINADNWVIFQKI